MPNFKIRDNTEEILDDFDLSGADLEKNLDEIEFINKRLGGNQLVIDGFEQIIQKHSFSKNQTISVADIGCGSGDVLRKLDHWGQRKPYSFKWHGYDANINILNYATSKMKASQSIQYNQLNIIEEAVKESYDIILMNLFLHHFTNDEIAQIINQLIPKTRVAILINDLHRHPVAYYSFLAMCSVLGFSELSKSDGSLSVLKAFTEKDLKEIVQKINPKNYSLKWRWAFRYQLILYIN